MASDVKVTEDIFQNCIFEFAISSYATLGKVRSKVKGQGHDKTKYGEKVEAYTMFDRQVISSIGFFVTFLA